MISDVVEILKRAHEDWKKGMPLRKVLFGVFILITIQSILTGIEYQLKSVSQTYKSLSVKWENFKLEYYNALKGIGKNLLWGISQALEKVGNIGIAETTIEIPEGWKKPLTGQ